MAVFHMNPEQSSLVRADYTRLDQQSLTCYEDSCFPMWHYSQMAVKYKKSCCNNSIK